MSLLAPIGCALFATSALNVFFGVLLLARGDRRDPVVPTTAMMAILNGAYAFVVAMAYVRASLGLDWNFYYRSAWVGWVALAPLIQSIILLRDEPRRARIVGWVLYAVWGTVLVLCWTTDLFEVGAVSLVPFVDRVGRFEQPARTLGGLTLCYALYEMYRVRRRSVGRKRQQISYFLLGMAIYAGAGLFLAGLPAVSKALRFDPGLVVFFSVFWMALIVYAMGRHRLFDIRIVLSRVLEALALTALLATFDILLFGRLALALRASTATAVVGVLSGVVVFMTPLPSWLGRGARRLLVPGRYDFQRATREFAQALGSVVDIQEVLRILLELTRQTLGPATGALFLKDEDRFRSKLTYGIGTAERELSGQSAVIQWVSSRAQVFVRDEQERILSTEELFAIDQELDPSEWQVAVPIRYQGALKGLLLLGRKQDRDAFLQRDVDLLETLATEAAIALSNMELLDELRLAVRTREEFLSIAAHELRTPLAALQLKVDGLLRSSLGPEQMHTRLLSARQQVSRLSRLTNELLDVSRMSAGGMALEPADTDLSAVVVEVAERLMENVTSELPLFALSLPGPLVGRWDPSRIEQMVTNLLSNAKKYGLGKQVSVAVQAMGTSARLTVSDHGIGIAKADQLRIFERFERAVSHHHYGGFGVGLWIAKRVIEAHGGSVDVTSEPNEGSTFVVELPMERRENA